MAHELWAATVDASGTQVPKPNTADAIVAWLRQIGVNTVFGVPGGPIMGMFDALARADGIRTVLCKHEQGAVFAAYGYARRAHRLGVVVVTSGPGTTNALSGLGSAAVDRVPILVLAGQVAGVRVGCGATQDGSPLGVDVVAMARPATAYSMAASSSAQALHTLPLLTAQALARRRPALLQLPADVLFAPAALPSAPGRPSTHHAGRVLDVGAADRALGALRKARRLAFLVGSGVEERATSTLLSVAEASGAAVATTPRAKGIFPEDHPLSVGVFGFAGTQWASHCIDDAGLDLLVVLGSSLGELSSDGWSDRLRPRHMIHVDRDPTVIGRTYAAQAVLGDTAAVLAHWQAGLTSSGPLQVPAWLHHITSTTSRSGELRTCRGDVRSDGRISPQALFAELQACLPERALVVSDIGNCMAYAIHHLVLSASQHFMANLGFACMGHAPAAALGAQLAEPGRPVIALVGDAAFAMGGFEVHTAVEYRPAYPACGGPVYIVLNDGGNGMVEAGARAQFGNDHRMDTGQYGTAIDVAAIARALGARAEVVRRSGELAPALENALVPNRAPTVIEVKLERGHMPPMGSRVQTLRHFAGAAQGE